MAAWPDSLPPPLRTVDIAPGNNTEAIEQASGRRIVRNWGHRPADQISVQFRITQIQEAEFKHFWLRVGMDVTWFTAPWLVAIGYEGHKARILGFPRRKGITSTWMDFAVTLLVAPAGVVVDGEPWPSGGTGVPPPPAPDEEYVALAHGSSSPFISIYPWNGEVGAFGVKFSNPTSAPSSSAGTGVAFTSVADYVAFTYQDFLYVNGVAAYPWLPGGGFGTRVTDPVTGPIYTGTGVVFSPADDYIAVSHSDYPFISVYPWTGAFGTKISDPSTAIPGYGTQVVFSPDGDYIAVAHQSSLPFVSTYPWSGSGFGTKLSDPSPAIGTSVYDLTFSPNGAVIAMAVSNTPYVKAYSWSAGFGSQVSNPVTVPSGFTGTGVAFSPDGNYIGVSGTASPCLISYPWVGGFSTILAYPSPAPSASEGRLHWSSTNDYVAVSQSSAPGVWVYAWAGGFGSRSSAPATVPDGAVFDVKFGLQPGG